MHFGGGVDVRGTFASVQDGFDLRTDAGRLVLRIMLSMAEYELERMRSNWNDAKARAVLVIGGSLVPATVSVPVRAPVAFMYPQGFVDRVDGALHLLPQGRR